MPAACLCTSHLGITCMLPWCGCCWSQHVDMAWPLCVAQHNIHYNGPGLVSHACRSPLGFVPQGYEGMLHDWNRSHAPRQQQQQMRRKQRAAGGSGSRPDPWGHTAAGEQTTLCLATVAAVLLLLMLLLHCLMWLASCCTGGHMALPRFAAPVSDGHQTVLGITLARCSQ